MAATASSTATATTKINNIPKWKASGDWFDVCKCNIACPCEFAQAPTYEECEGILAYHINKGNYHNCWSILMEIHHKKNIGIAKVVFTININLFEREI